MTSLARLASDTGGQHTEKTNDLTLGYARARRAMSCVYSVGFYVDEYDEDEPQNLSIHIRRPGLRAIHPSKFVVRSPEAQRASLMNAAWNSPDLFKTGVIRAHAFPLRPADKDTWEVLLAVRFPIHPEAETAPRTARVRDFGAMVWSGTRVVHRFNRRVTIEPLVDDPKQEPVFTFVEQMRLEPGNHRVTVVMNTPGKFEQHAAELVVSVPLVPRSELFVAGPTLGKKVGNDLVVIAENDNPADDRIAVAESFAPLLVQIVETPEDLVFLTDACFVGSPKAVRSVEGLAAALERGIDGAIDKNLEPISTVPLDLKGTGQVRCQAVVDVLPSPALADGDFVFSARVDRETKVGQPGGEVDFSVDLTEED